MRAERVGELLGELPPAPESWVRAAQELPRARREIDRLVALARADPELSAVLLANAETALRSVGLEPAPRVVAALRARLGG